MRAHHGVLSDMLERTVQKRFAIKPASVYFENMGNAADS